MYKFYIPSLCQSKMKLLSLIFSCYFIHRTPLASGSSFLELESTTRISPTTSIFSSKAEIESLEEDGGRKSKIGILFEQAMTKTSKNQMSFKDCTCHFFLQPLDHFATGASSKVRYLHENKNRDKGKNNEEATETVDMNMTLQQRYCIYDGYEKKASEFRSSSDKYNDDQLINPIFFYAGNESPVETYANHTGLMWTLASKHNALVVFAEHRYEGLSLPSAIIKNNDHNTVNVQNFPNCLSYVSSSQALADYAHLLSYLNPGNVRPVIVFGGSYGGMLSSWMRMKYPTSVAGAISSSAPIWATPLTRPKMNSANVAISRGVLLSDAEDHRLSSDQKPGMLQDKQNQQQEREKEGFKETQTKKKNNIELDAHTGGGHCFNNLLSVWPLMKLYSETAYGRSVLNESFRLCPKHELRKPSQIHQLLEWAQSPWFPLAEGNYPFESNYITFALLKYAEVKLPKWPIKEACHRGGLNLYQNVKIIPVDNNNDDDNNVKFDIAVSKINEQEQESEVMRLHIDWDKMYTEQEYNEDQMKIVSESGAAALFEAVREAVGVWFNVTNDKECFELNTAVSSSHTNQTHSNLKSHYQKPFHVDAMFAMNNDVSSGPSTTVTESRKLEIEKQFSSFSRIAKTPITPVMNEDQPQSCSVKIAQEGSWSSICCNENLNLPIMIAQGIGNDFFWPPNLSRGTTLNDILSQSNTNNNVGYCSDPMRLYGYPLTADPWSNWIDDYYGGLRIGMHSNIIFSNGLLDPWSGGGVYPGNPPPTGLYEGDTKVNITKDGSIIALLIDNGAHHLDLFFESDDDPESVKEVREIEDEYIGNWIREWEEQTCVGEVCIVR